MTAPARICFDSFDSPSMSANNKCHVRFVNLDYVEEAAVYATQFVIYSNPGSPGRKLGVFVH